MEHFVVRRTGAGPVEAEQVPSRAVAIALTSGHILHTAQLYVEADTKEDAEAEARRVWGLDADAELQEQA